MRKLALTVLVAAAVGGLPAAMSAQARDASFALIERGRHLVNAGDCVACHTTKGGKPFAGGRPVVTPFGTIYSANITPDALGRPAGLTLNQFSATLRTGHNPLDPPGVLLQVMPWPAFGKKTDRDLTAIYEYLRSIPSIENNGS